MGLAKLEMGLVKQLYGAVGVVLVGIGLMIKFMIYEQASRLDLEVATRWILGCRDLNYVL